MLLLHTCYCYMNLARRLHKFYKNITGVSLWKYYKNTIGILCDLLLVSLNKMEWNKDRWMGFKRIHFGSKLILFTQMYCMYGLVLY